VLAATVAVVLADSSVVTLGLPDILAEFDATVAGAAGVLIAFNLVLAVLLVPAAALADRAGPGRTWAAGVLVLAAGSLVCALAEAMTALVAGRVVQAAGGAAVLAGAVAVLAANRGSEQGGAAVWGPAGVVGLALGPVAGGLLTELLSWQAIFAVQVPMALLALTTERGRSPFFPPGARTAVATSVSLALLAAALTAALFLLVILLTRGWEYSALEAAAIVTVMAVATIAAGPLERRLPPDRWVAAGGVIAVSAGLAALGLLPGAGWGWTVAPQVLIGLGLGLSLPVLTAHALDAGGRGRAAIGTLCVRHAGVVAGLLVLVPLFSTDLETQQRAAERAGTALLLEAHLSPRTKLALGDALARQIRRADGRLPQLGPAFDAVPAPAGAEADHARLQAALGEELDRAATQAFSRSFLAAAALGLLTLLPLAAATRRRRA
jgi:hypothetical protein